MSNVDLFMACYHALLKFSELRSDGPLITMVVELDTFGRTIRFEHYRSRIKWTIVGDDYVAVMTGVNDNGVDNRVVKIEGDRDAMVRDVVLLNLADRG